MPDLRELFSPFRIRSMELKNRIVMPPMGTDYADSEGFITDRQIAYYLERVKGGVGYVTFEHTGILQSGRASAHMAMISDDVHIPGFKALSEAIRNEGGKLVVQINHAGRQTSSKVTKCPIVAPSPIPCPVVREMPHALSRSEIQEIVEAFALAAGRVKKAGADGVEIHMAHGYLLNQFLSPLSNQRGDDYGGSLEGRLRLPLQVLCAVREHVGEHYPIICRLSGDEYMEGGLRLGDTQEISKRLEANGADALHISAGQYGSTYIIQPSYYLDEGVIVHLAEGIKKTVNIPVITVGRIRTPMMAEEIIRSGKADLVSMGRALIADPQLPSKALEGRLEEIVPCISDNVCSLSLMRGGGLHCTVNPTAGNENRFKAMRASQSRKVWVIGGGPAGMKAAQISALRGHDVTLYEKSNRLGGRFVLAAVPPKKQVLRELIEYLNWQLNKLHVKILTGISFHPDLLTENRPHVVILATGSNSAIPPIPGIESAGVVTDEQVLDGEIDPDGNILIVGGGGIGAEVADYLSEKGKKVTLVEMKREVASDLPPHQQYFLRRRLKKKGVRILTSTKVVRFKGKALMVEGPEGHKTLEEFDSIIVSMGSKSNNELADQLKEKVSDLYVIGDALQPRNVMEALLEAQELAFRI